MRLRLLFRPLVFSAALLALAGCHVAYLPVVREKPLPLPDPATRARLVRDIDYLAGEIGERNVYSRPGALQQTREWIRRELGPVSRLQPDVADVPSRFVTAELDARAGDRNVANVVAELAPDPAHAINEVIVIGAHYDTMTYSPEWVGSKHELFAPGIRGTPGANDNASGVAALLEIARQLRGRRLDRPVRFVAFGNEEPPFFQTRAAMGSYVYARQCKERDDPIAMMISLDALAVYSDDGRREKRPWWKGLLAHLRGLPRKPDYVAFMSNWDGDSGPRALDWAKTFHDSATIDVRTISLPFWANLGTEVFAWSDDWSFTRFDYPAFTVTDTAFLRSDRYHETWDRPAALNDHDRDMFTRVVEGLVNMIEAKANHPLPLIPAKKP